MLTSYLWHVAETNVGGVSGPGTDRDIGVKLTWMSDYVREHFGDVGRTLTIALDARISDDPASMETVSI